MNKKLLTAKQVSIKLFSVAVAASIALSSCGDGDGSPRFKDMEEVEHKLSTKGVICEAEEVEPGDEYKVINEEMIDDKEQSLAIIHYLDNHTDTLTLATIAREKTRYRGLNRFLLGTMAGTYFMRNISGFRPNRSNYKTGAAYTKSSGMSSSFQSSATSRRVKVPGKGSRGYGKGRSFRSYGG